MERHPEYVGDYGMIHYRDGNGDGQPNLTPGASCDANPGFADAIIKIDAAIKRIDRGDYGTCESCERHIPKARLKALPYARLCVKCREDEERNGI